MGSRVQVILSEEEREAFRLQAAAEHMSLSNWLRQAGLKRLESQQQRPIRTTGELREFFSSLSDDSEPEPDWDSHLQVIQESRGKGATTT